MLICMLYACWICCHAFQIYGLVLVLLAIAEFDLFKIKGQYASKKAMLQAMAIADVIHVVCFARYWFMEKGEIDL
jgi:hypothetical protein